MAEEAYPKDHPAHPDNAGKKGLRLYSPIENDYKADHPARGGQGQPVPIEAASTEPRDGFKHLHGLAAYTLAERLKEFSGLPPAEQAARLKWNETGIPAPPEQE